MSGECRQQLTSEFVLENASFSTCHVQQVSARLRVTAFHRDQHLDATAAAFSGADTRDRETGRLCLSGSLTTGPAGAGPLLPRLTAG